MAVEQRHRAEQVVVIEPESEIARVLDQASDAPLIVQMDGVRYRIERQSDGLIHPPNPRGLREALDRSFGSMAGTFTEEFRRELREQGEQDSHGRPADT